jgi:hypothetical protein
MQAIQHCYGSPYTMIDGYQIYMELPHRFEDYVIQLAGIAITATNQQLVCILL